MLKDEIDKIILGLMKKCLDKGIELGLKGARVGGHHTLDVSEDRTQALTRILELVEKDERI